MLAFPVMKKLTGTVRRNDLGGGHWVLETEDGDTYQLSGDVGALKDGMRATVEGKVERDMMGIGMTGPHFKVEKLTAL